jgi:hypothetical protein
MHTLEAELMRMSARLRGDRSCQDRRGRWRSGLAFIGIALQDSPKSMQSLAAVNACLQVQLLTSTSTGGPSSHAGHVHRCIAAHGWIHGGLRVVPEMRWMHAPPATGIDFCAAEPIGGVGSVIVGD